MSKPSKIDQSPPCYVMGLMFNEHLNTVALIQKSRPQWQRGRFNGIGGKIEYGESPLEAMCREFEEEAALKTHPTTWRLFLTMRGKNDDGAPFMVDCFCARGPIERIVSLTDEKVFFVPVDTIRLESPSMIENVPWLIGCALDMLRDGRPSFITVDY